jgi:hypothetical protein
LPQLFYYLTMNKDSNLERGQILCLDDWFCNWTHQIHLVLFPPAKKVASLCQSVLVQTYILPIFLCEVMCIWNMTMDS